MDDEDAELVRLALWALFAAARLTHPATPGHRGVTIAKPLAEQAAGTADTLLAAAVKRFPFLRPPDPTGGLGPS